jgi:hypothetical protein
MRVSPLAASFTVPLTVCFVCAKITKLGSKSKIDNNELIDGSNIPTPE